MFSAATGLDDEQRGLDGAEVCAIRDSKQPAVSFARHYRVSETLIRKIRAKRDWIETPERRRNDIPRLAVVAALVLAGPRISELCHLDGRHVGLARRVTRMPRVKTDVSEHEILLAHRADYAWGADEPVFATRNGTRNTPDNLRRYVVPSVHARANELIQEGGSAEIAELTPHTLRRTLASLVAELGSARAGR